MQPLLPLSHAHHYDRPLVEEIQMDLCSSPTPTVPSQRAVQARAREDWPIVHKILSKSSCFFTKKFMFSQKVHVFQNFAKLT